MIYCHYAASTGHTYLLKTEGPNVARGVAHLSQYEMLKQLGKKMAVQVCSLNCISKMRCRTENDLLTSLSKFDERANVGGWRYAEQDMVCLEVANFNPILALAGQDYLRSEVFVRHPAVVGGLMFPFPNGILMHTLCILRAIFDMRRFIDLEHPKKKYFLREHFKLTTPQRFFKMFTENAVLDQDDYKAKMMLDAWYEQPLQFANPDSEEFNSSRAFLFRHYWDVTNEMLKNHSKEKALVYGLWKTTTLFCDFLQLVWQHGLADRVFDPVQFFADEKVTEEFCTFIKRVDKGLDISKPDIKDSL